MIIITALVWMLLAGTPVRGQTDGPSPPAPDAPALELSRQRAQSRVSAELSRRAALEVGRFLAPHQFSCWVQAQLRPSGLTQAPYAPTAFTSSALQGFATAEIVALTSGVEINLVLSDQIASGPAEAIRSVLSQRLSLNPARGDQVNVTSMPLGELSPEKQQANALTRELANLRQQLETTQQERSQIARSLADMEQQATAAQRQSGQQQALLDQRSRELATIEAKLAQMEGAEKNLRDQLQTVQNMNQPAFVERLAQTVGGPFLLAIALILLSLAISLAMARAFSTLARGMSASGDAIGSGLQAIASQFGAEQEKEGGASPSSVVSEVGAQAFADIPQLDQQELYTFTQTVRDQFETRWTKDVATEIAIFVQSLVLRNRQVEVAYVILELLGTAKAGDVFGQLSRSAQRKLRRFSQNPMYTATKAKLLVHAGEMLSGLLFAEQLRDGALAHNAQLKAKLDQLDDDELLALASESPPPLVAKLMLLISEERITQLFQKSSARSETLSLLAESLVYIPMAENDPKLESDLVGALEAFQKRHQGHLHKNYLDLYRNVIEDTPEHVTEQILSHIESVDEAVGLQLRHTVLTFKSLFSLTPARIAAVVDGLSNHEIAVLLRSLDNEQQRQALVAGFSSRRREMIADEREVVASRQPGEVREQALKIRQRLLSELRNQVEAARRLGEEAPAPPLPPSRGVA